MENDTGLVARLVAGAGGAALVVSVFLSWYSLSFADVLRGVASQLPPQFSGSLPVALTPDPRLTWSGWDAVHVITLVVVCVGLFALWRSISPPSVAADHGAMVLPAGGLLAAVLVAYRIESPPQTLNISVGPFQIPSPTGTGLTLSSLLHIELGAWIALVGAVLVLLGGLLALANERAAHVQPITLATTDAGGEATVGAAAN